MVSLEEPIGNTCPDIDYILEELEEALYRIKNAQEDIESLRNDNYTLRQWGIDLAERVKYLEGLLDDNGVADY